MTRWLSRWLIRAADAATRDRIATLEMRVAMWHRVARSLARTVGEKNAKLSRLHGELGELRAELADRRQAVFGRLLGVRTADGKLWHPADVQHVYPGEVDRP